ncbi:hypothetical protein ACN47E_007549 [Coniothyrium glycines]
MKRKFSFNLAPIKTSEKADDKADDKPTPDPIPALPSDKTHHRQSSKDSEESKESRSSRDGVCDNSAYICRRPLDLQTEKELRVACRLILQNLKPSDHGMEDTDPKLDFGAMDRRRDKKQQSATEIRVRMPTGAPTDLTAPSVGRKPSKARTRDKADREIRARGQVDVPVRATSTRKPRDFGWLDERDDKRDGKLRAYGKSSIDLPRAPVMGSDSDENISLPVTVTSTLATSKVASTAPTSASLPSGEREKFKQHDAARPSTALRTPSRSASIKENIRGYVFPGSRSRAISRAQSSESLRTDATSDSEGLQRSGSRAGRRIWGVARMLSTRSTSRPGTSRGQPEETEPRKSEALEVNLNRELPPLPSLDTWKDSQQRKEDKPISPKSPVAGTHIASLMRAQEQQHQIRSPAARSHHRKSGSDTLAMQLNQAYPAQGSSRHQIEIPTSPHARKSGPSSPINNSHAAKIVPLSVSPDQCHELDSRTPGHNRQRSGDADSLPTSITKSTDPASSSRNVSLDITAKSHSSGGSKGIRKEEQKSRLRKVFSGWILKKDKKDGWMHRMEKESVKDGALVPEGAASPVVR